MVKKRTYRKKRSYKKKNKRSYKSKKKSYKKRSYQKVKYLTGKGTSCEYLTYEDCLIAKNIHGAGTNKRSCVFDYKNQICKNSSK